MSSIKVETNYDEDNSNIFNVNEFTMVYIQFYIT